MPKAKHRVIVRARRADNGRFTTKAYAEKHPDKTIIDRMKVHPKK